MRSRVFVSLALSVILVSAFCIAEDSADFHQREYQASADSVRSALHSLNASKGSRLPTLDGFVKSEALQIDHYERPYYDFKIEVQPAEAGKTVLKVKATISAWYAGTVSESGYRILQSNGRLENDLLDRVEEYLKAPTATADTANLEEKIAETKKLREAAEQHVAELEIQVKTGVGPVTPAEADAEKHNKEEFISIPSGKVNVLSAPQEKANVLLNAEPDDEFQVLGQKGNYINIKLQGQDSGWVPRSQVRPATMPQATPSPSSGADESFNIVKQGVTTFDGDWSPLKGKKVLYLWARPAGSPLNHSPANHLAFAESTFVEHYREAAHNSQNALEGIVVIFLDQGGGVAAATLQDAKLWQDGELTRSSFLKRCSFDPYSEFAEAAAASRHDPTPRKR